LSIVRSGYVESLTALRGVACIVVLFYHIREWFQLLGFYFVSELLKFGYLGVDLFFVLSGFVIHNSYSNRVDLFHFRSVVSFVFARYARVWPAHVAVLVLMIPVPFILLFFSKSMIVPPHYDLDYFILSVLLIQNWGFQDQLKWNVPSWSVSVETFAYLAYPVLAFLVAKLKSLGSIRFLSSLYVIIILSSLSLQFLYTYIGVESIGDKIESVGLFRCLLEFIVGVCVAELARDRRTVMRLACLLVCIVVVGSLSSFKNFYIAIVPVTVAVIVSVSVVWNPTISHWRCGKILLFVGEISYSLYLVHMPIMYLFIYLEIPRLSILVTICLYLTVVLFASVCLHRFIEIPGINFARDRLKS
jgi:peptidoglycan/LPS O-acetylase OafA/YrhL